MSDPHAANLEESDLPFLDGTRARAVLREVGLERPGHEHQRIPVILLPVALVELMKHGYWQTLCVRGFALPPKLELCGSPAQIHVFNELRRSAKLEYERKANVPPVQIDAAAMVSIRANLERWGPWILEASRRAAPAAVDDDEFELGVGVDAEYEKLDRAINILRKWNHLLHSQTVNLTKALIIPFGCCLIASCTPSY